MTSSISLDPPFAYNPGCKPTKSILKQRATTTSTSWLARLSSTDIFPPPQTPIPSQQQQQRSFSLFRKLINSTSNATTIQNSSPVSTNTTPSVNSPTEIDELSSAELKRVRFSVNKLTTEYFPYSTDDNEDNNNPVTNNTEITTSPIPTTTSDKTDTTHTTEMTTPEKVLSYYETACKNKEEPLLDAFTFSLLSHPQTSILTHIDLSNQELNRRSVEPFADVLCLDLGLEKLTLRNCQLEDESLKVILHSLLVVNQLKHLDLSDNKKIQTNGFKYISIYIKEASTLEVLDLSGTNPDKKSINYISQALSHASTRTTTSSLSNSGLRKLIMNTCNLRQTHLESLGNAIRRSSLLYLSLCNNRINQQGAIYIGVMLRDYDDPVTQTNGNIQSLRGLQHLVLDYNDLRQGVQYIAQALRRNQSLRSLSMTDCKLDTQCCVSVAEALKYNQSLEILSLSSNPLCNEQQLEGIISLKQSLYCNHSLSELNLADTGLGSEAAVQLAECLPENTKLARLDLSRNSSIDLTGLMALMSGLQMNSTLVFLDVNIPAKNRDMVKVQSEMAALCTRNAQVVDNNNNNNNVSRTPSLNSIDTNHSSITTTHATARLTLQERLAAVTKGKNSRANSIRSMNSVENLRPTSSPVSRSTPEVPSRNRKVQTNFDVEMSQVGLLEEMLQAEESTEETQDDNDIRRPNDAIVQVYLQCRKGLLNLNNSIPQLMDSDHLMDLLGLNDRLTSAIANYEETFNKPPRMPNRPTKTTQSPIDNSNSIDKERSESPFEIGEDDEEEEEQDDVDDSNVLNETDSKDIHELRKEKEVEEGTAFKHAKDTEDTIL